MAKSLLENQFALLMLAEAQHNGVEIPPPKREHRFHPKRKWRFDFAWPDQKVAVEIEGGTWSGGRHARGAGIAADCEKYNTATAMGWRVLRFTSKQLNVPKDVFETVCETLGFFC